MCGRLVVPDDAAINQYLSPSIQATQPFRRRFNVAPTAQVPMIAANSSGKRELKSSRWGLVPPWWKEPRLPGHTFNARSEDVRKKPMWRNAIRNARCLLPAEGWYEWQSLEVIDSETGEVIARKQPYFIHAATRPLIALAGLYAVWHRADAEPLLSCAVLTREASPSLQVIHKRMPVVLNETGWEQWLAPAEDPAEIDSLLAGSEGDLAFHPVSIRVNNARIDDESLITPVEADDSSNTARR